MFRVIKPLVNIILVAAKVNVLYKNDPYNDPTDVSNNDPVNNGRL